MKAHTTSLPCRQSARFGAATYNRDNDDSLSRRQHQQQQQQLQQRPLDDELGAQHMHSIRIVTAQMSSVVQYWVTTNALH